MAREGGDGVAEKKVEGQDRPSLPCPAAGSAPSVLPRYLSPALFLCLLRSHYDRRHPANNANAPAQGTVRPSRPRCLSTWQLNGPGCPALAIPQPGSSWGLRSDARPDNCHRLCKNATSHHVKHLPKSKALI